MLETFCNSMVLSDSSSPSVHTFLATSLTRTCDYVCHVQFTLLYWLIWKTTSCECKMFLWYLKVLSKCRCFHYQLILNAIFRFSPFSRANGKQPCSGSLHSVSKTTVFYGNQTVTARNLCSSLLRNCVPNSRQTTKLYPSLRVVCSCTPALRHHKYVFLLYVHLLVCVFASVLTGVTICPSLMSAEFSERDVGDANAYPPSRSKQALESHVNDAGE